MNSLKSKFLWKLPFSSWRKLIMSLNSLDNWLINLWKQSYYQRCWEIYCGYLNIFYRTYLGSFFAVQAIANLLSISLTKQRLILVVAFSRVLSKFLTKLLHLSIQELVLSMTHLALTGTKPLCPCFFFEGFRGLRWELKPNLGHNRWINFFQLNR